MLYVAINTGLAIENKSSIVFKRYVCMRVHMNTWVHMSTYMFMNIINDDRYSVTNGNFLVCILGVK